MVEALILLAKSLTLPGVAPVITPVITSVVAKTLAICPEVLPIYLRDRGGGGYDRRGAEPALLVLAERPAILAPILAPILAKALPILAEALATLSEVALRLLQLLHNGRQRWLLDLRLEPRFGLAWGLKFGLRRGALLTLKARRAAATVILEAIGRGLTKITTTAATAIILRDLAHLISRAKLIFRLLWLCHGGGGEHGGRRQQSD